MASLPALVLSQFGECLHFLKVNIYIYNYIIEISDCCSWYQVTSSILQTSL